MNDLKTVRDALGALLNYKQADAEGIMVLTSRQAIHEIADYVKDTLDRMIETPAPQGWKLVPIEPTMDMLCEGIASANPITLAPSIYMFKIYKAMLSAAPTPAPTEKVEQEPPPVCPCCKRNVYQLGKSYFVSEPVCDDCLREWYGGGQPDGSAESIAKNVIKTHGEYGGCAITKKDMYKYLKLQSGETEKVDVDKIIEDVKANWLWDKLNPDFVPCAPSIRATINILANTGRLR